MRFRTVRPGHLPDRDKCRHAARAYVDRQRAAAFVRLGAGVSRDARVPRRIDDTALMRWHGSIGDAWPWAPVEPAASP